MLTFLGREEDCRDVNVLGLLRWRSGDHIHVISRNAWICYGRYAFFAVASPVLVDATDISGVVLLIFLD